MLDIPLIFNLHPIAAAAMTANLDSGVIYLDRVTGYCVQAIWTGTPAGNIVISGSNDGIHFTVISTTAAGGAAGSLLSDVVRANYVFLKVNYTFTSSTGVLDVLVSGKR